jgi:hypothetical protein
MMNGALPLVSGVPPITARCMLAVARRILVEVGVSIVMSPALQQGLPPSEGQYPWQTALFFMCFPFEPLIRGSKIIRITCFQSGDQVSISTTLTLLVGVKTVIMAFAMDALMLLHY